MSEISVCEDWITNQAIWEKVNKYIAISDVVYAYFINPKSMMQSTVLSHQYINKIGDLMKQITSNSSKEISQIIELDRIASHIRSIFIPEVLWNSDEYKKIRTFIDEANNLQEIQTYIDKRFLRFIKSKPLFMAYSRIYAHAFKLLKLKGHKRSIL
jgi:hypothetical protein